ncbi:MAG: bifunctional riboflavin kinase/FAD synthetase [Verrucomicrobiota bacterium]
MRVLSSVPELTTVSGPVVLAIGVFDGIHLGHRAVLQRAQLEAARICGTAIPLTFDPHPARIIRPDQAPLQLTTNAHKTRLFAALGFSHALILPFNQTLAATEPAAFITGLTNAAAPLSAICVGHDWSFGKGRAGNLGLLRTLGKQLSFEVIGVESVHWQNEPISSTRLRQSIGSGDFESANAMLGRPFTLLGSVKQGKQLGRTLGFPTANLTLFNEQLPPKGVYAVKIIWGNQTLPGVANLGTRPTIDGEIGEVLLEVHLLDFSGDLYGELLEIEFASFLRAEKRFDSIDSLRAQIKCDAESARTALYSIAAKAYR